METPFTRWREFQAVRVPILQLERFCGEPLGNLHIDCYGCMEELTDTDKLYCINKEGTVLLREGILLSFCESCASALVV